MTDERPITKHFEMPDEAVRRAVFDLFAPGFRHGYHLHEVVRSSAHGGWHCIWRRTAESYAKDFDWTLEDTHD